MRQEVDKGSTSFSSAAVQTRTVQFYIKEFHSGIQTLEHIKYLLHSCQDFLGVSFGRKQKIHLKSQQTTLKNIPSAFQYVTFTFIFLHTHIETSNRENTPLSKLKKKLSSSQITDQHITCSKCSHFPCEQLSPSHLPRHPPGVLSPALGPQHKEGMDLLHRVQRGHEDVRGLQDLS